MSSIDLSKPPENKAELDAKIRKEYPLFFIEMNYAQDRFIRVKNSKGSTPRRRIFEAGNKVGKCVTYDTLIDTPNGEIPIGKLFEIGKPFDVYAWDGKKKVVSRATAPFKKDGLHQCYRITMSDGRWIEAADYHNVLTHLGYESVSSLYHLFSYGLLPLLVDGNYIISIEPIPVKCDVYDFSVKKYHNYFAGGLINHNTMIGLMEDIAHMMGFRPWLLKTDPDYRIPIKVPNIGMLGCETYKHSVAEKIEPMLRWLVPSTCQPVFKPGPTGVLNILTLPFDAKGGKCGSKMHIRSYDEQASTYEGQDYDFQHFDEPPPEDILVAAERGKIVTNAPSWFTMTPLKSPFIFDRFSSRAAIHA